MKVLNITKTKGKKLVDGTLPDIDSDFEGKARGKIKTYIEKRFGETQVCSVGTVVQIKPKGAIKDIDRQFDNDYSKANIITSIISETDTSMLDVYKRAASENKLKQYIKQQSYIFHLMPTILGQPKTKSIHPCAMIIFPSLMEASQWCPVRRQKGLIVSEWDGYQMDDAGFLKEDILGIKQLDKFADILKLIKENNKNVPDIYNLPDDREVYRYFGNGWNGDIFQFGTTGLIDYTRRMKPQSLEDLFAANALYRPGPMENHYHEIYIKCKNEGRVPEYLWGTEEITKNTFGLIVYQEQVMQVCQQLGGLTMKEADDVRRAMGKKNVDILKEWKDRVKKGFLEKGCPKDEFENIWDVLLEFAKYSFNRSHSAAYAQTAYIGMYLKVHFPLEFWTVALYYANENDKLRFLSEIFQSGEVSIMPPDINSSDIEMISDMDNKNIFWGIGSIKGIGEATAEQIIKEREDNGKYLSFENFLERHNFKGSKVKKQTYEALISAGAFDRLYEFKNNEQKRFDLIKNYREQKKVKISNPQRDPYTIGNIVEKWWWLKKQKELTGLAFINYEEISNNIGIESQFINNRELSTKQDRGIFRTFGGYVVECKISRSKKGSFARIQIESNYKLYKIIIWNDQYETFKSELKNCEKGFMIFSGFFKYESKWTKGNQWTLNDSSILKVLQ